MSFPETMSSRPTLLSDKVTPGALPLQTHEVCHHQISGHSQEVIP